MELKCVDESSTKDFLYLIPHDDEEIGSQVSELYDKTAIKKKDKYNGKKDKQVDILVIIGYVLIDKSSCKQVLAQWPPLVDNQEIMNVRTRRMK